MACRTSVVRRASGGPIRSSGAAAFEEISNPVWFRTDPEQAWGFFGHRLNLYRTTAPHAGFEILRRWGQRCPKGYFVFTSNVDGHFQRAGFAPERVLECHGSIHYLQCTRPCSEAIWSAEAATIDVDADTIRAAHRCRVARTAAALPGPMC